MRNYFTFNGVDSRDYGIYISGTGRLTIPEKLYDFQNIAGRNGDLIVDAAATPQNDVITYPAFIKPFDNRGVPVSYSEMFGKMRSWLLNVKGYAELRDSYDCKHYRLGAFAGPLSPETTPVLDAGSFDIEFNCKPQRYINDDSEQYVLSAGESMTVKACPYYHAEPLIRVNRPGTFVVGNNTVTVAAGSYAFPIFIDCRLLECYDYTGESVNRYVTFSTYNFPEISNGVEIASTDVQITVTPRWYEL